MSQKLEWNHELDSNQYLCATFPLVDHDGLGTPPPFLSRYEVSE